MDETIYQGGELITGILTALICISGIVLLLGSTDAGVFRTYLAYLLEAAC